MGQVIMSGIVPKLTVPSALPPVGTSLNDMAWEDIVKISDAGQAANYFAIGDTKGVPLNGTVGQVTFSGETYYAFIIGIDHNESYEGKGIHFQFGKTADGGDIAFIDSKYTSTYPSLDIFSLYNSMTSSGGWKSSRMRTIICPAFLAALPAELQAVISECTKYTDNVGGGGESASSITATQDKIWLLSEFEVLAARNYGNTYEQNYQKQYDYYAAGNSKVKYRHSATGSTAIWWTRSPAYTTGYSFCGINVGGNPYAAGANTSYGFAPGFKVGGAAA